jgi:hypothetical protein
MRFYGYNKGMELTPDQLAVIASPIQSKTLLTGPAGTGKTTAAVERVLALIRAGVPADSILILTPQRTLQEIYIQTLLNEPFSGGEVTPATVGGLARRMVELFWPLVAEQAGFARPDRPPVFLTMESAQYYMAHLVRPMLDEGFFSSLTMDRNRLYAQIIDNLNKAAFVGFDYREIGDRLTAAWTGDPAQRRVYADAQDCAIRFREFCLAHNLLDFSLQLEIFWKILWNDETVHAYLTRTYRHLIYDNVEEDIPIAHDLIEQWLPEFDSALIVSDEDGGYRKFLGADPDSARRFGNLIETIPFTQGFVQSEAIAQLEYGLVEAIRPLGRIPREMSGMKGYDFIIARFYPEMLDSVVSKIKSLINEAQVPAGEIVVVAPFLSDALRFSLMNRLTAAQIPNRSNRPSRSLNDEPAAAALITLAALAHPHWNAHPARFDAAYAFMLALDGDLVRAHLLAEIVYRQKDLRLAPFAEINAGMQERITYALGSRYAELRDWLLDYRDGEQLPFDHFLRKLFGEVLSRFGFGFHANLDAARVAASLIESIRKFRLAMEPAYVGLDSPAFDLGREYISMLREGVIAAQYLPSYRGDDNAVLIAPVTTFLMMNRPVTIQFWLDVGSSGWAERLSQPLTQPYVLSRNWEANRPWTDADEVATNTESLARLASGLLRRCRERVYLGLSDLGETGYEQRGVLMRAFQKVLTEVSSD